MKPSDELEILARREELLEALVEARDTQDIEKYKKIRKHILFPEFFYVICQSERRYPRFLEYEEVVGGYCPCLLYACRCILSRQRGQCPHNLHTCRCIPVTNDFPMCALRWAVDRNHSECFKSLLDCDFEISRAQVRELYDRIAEKDEHEILKKEPYIYTGDTRVSLSIYLHKWCLDRKT